MAELCSWYVLTMAIATISEKSLPLTESEARITKGRRQMARWPLLPRFAGTGEESPGST